MLFFAAGNGFLRPAKAGAAPGFNLNEHHFIAVCADNIDFSEGSAVISLQDTIAQFLQVVCGQIFTYFAQGICH